MCYSDIHSVVDDCMGSWSTGCNDDGENCLYRARWMVLGDANSVFFAVEARTPGWVGIGFSENRMMVRDPWCTTDVHVTFLLLNVCKVIFT